MIFKKRLYQKKGEDHNILLSFDQILGAAFITRSKLVKKSVIGRAFMGGILFGDTGAILGAMSGQEKKKEQCFAINHPPKKGQEGEIRL